MNPSIFLFEFSALANPPKEKYSVNYQPLKELALPLEGIAYGFGAGSLPTKLHASTSKQDGFDFI